MIGTLYSCDGLFPSAVKSNVPADHNNTFGGFHHKGDRNSASPEACGPCHTADLRGKVSLINGVYTWANSCYQCHGKVWGRNGNK